MRGKVCSGSASVSRERERGKPANWLAGYSLSMAFYGNCVGGGSGVGIGPGFGRGSGVGFGVGFGLGSGAGFGVGLTLFFQKSACFAQ
jgi:hypothetical protein